MRIHVGVKRRQGDPPKFHRVAVAVLLDDDVGARFLVLQFNLVAHELDRLALGRVGRGRRDDEETNFGAFFTANLLDHLVEAHFADIDKFLWALGDGGDAIAHFQAPARLRRTAHHEALDLGVAVFAAQHRADADEREAHVDAEVFQVGRTQVFRVRIVGLGEGVEEQLHLLFGVLLVDVAQHPVVAALDQFRTRLDRVIAQLLLQKLVYDSVVPEFIRLGLVLRPGRFLPV